MLASCSYLSLHYRCLLHSLDSHSPSLPLLLSLAIALALCASVSAAARSSCKIVAYFCAALHNLRLGNRQRSGCKIVAYFCAALFNLRLGNCCLRIAAVINAVKLTFARAGASASITLSCCVLSH